jgi:FkbM family methyltransferase
MRESVVAQPDLVYDIGMHKGEDTAFYLAKGHRVVAFEANPDLVAGGERRFATEIAAGRLTIRAGAISDSDAPSVGFYLHPNSVWGTTRETWAERNALLGESRRIDVPTLDLAAEIRKTGMPEFVKIDIEGADRACLAVLARFDPGPRYVSIESEKERWDDLIDEFGMLEAIGFTRFAVVQQATIPGRSIQVEGAPCPYVFEPDASGPFGDDIGPWLSREAAETRYKAIFRRYRTWGPRSLTQRTKVGRVFRGQAQRISRRPLPGWFDTHARRD